MITTWIQRLKRLIRGGDATIVEKAIRIVEGGVPSCSALSNAGATVRFIERYSRHSMAHIRASGFKDIPDREWRRMRIDGRIKVRVERLTAFKESLK